LRFTISLIVLLALASTVSAQKKLKADTVKKDFLPTGIRLGTDALALIRSQTDKTFKGYEFSADVDFYKYYLTAEAGKWEREFVTSNETYANTGNYMRIGIDYNFLSKDPDKNMFFIGARYGWGTFTEKFNLTIEDPVWGSISNTYINTDVKAGWGELTTGLRVKMWKFFWMGYTARYKFGLNTNTPEGFTSHDVPGYGKTAKPSTWGFNYQLLFRIPLRKKQPDLNSILKKAIEK